MRTLGKRVYRKVSRVRIPPLPQKSFLTDKSVRNDFGGVYCTKLELILKAILMPTNRTRGARDGSELNRTLHESPATASLHSATPKRKMFLTLLIFAGVDFFLKWKGYFSFWGSTLQVFGQCGGASIRTRFCENYFLGIWIFAKPRLIFFLHFVRAEEGSGEESARASFRIFGGFKKGKKNDKIKLPWNS